MVEKYLRRPSLRVFLSDSDISNGSIIWNGILKARPLANSKAKWKVGNGESILFWHDNWLIQSPLINYPTYEKWANTYIRMFGLKVRDYMTD